MWIITGIAGVSDQCAGLTGSALEQCEAGTAVGASIGVGLIIFLWAAVDVILGLTYIVYGLTRRQPPST
ncbi:hypothetical protein ACLIYP_21650 [Streptomyces nanhaiensis]|uniref:hypothetical protein n=1 Tax=Streptomyces nanhaiensis TaxID=679319 RepID=UPI00399C5F2E